MAEKHDSFIETYKNSLEWWLFTSTLVFCQCFYWTQVDRCFVVLDVKGRYNLEVVPIVLTLIIVSASLEGCFFNNSLSSRTIICLLQLEECLQWIVICLMFHQFSCMGYHVRQYYLIWGMLIDGNNCFECRYRRLEAVRPLCCMLIQIL
jgi:hypothetical protein